MALESLENVIELGNKTSGMFPILKSRGEAYPTPTAPIVVDNAQNVIAFKIQNGPIKKVGANGCQVDHLVFAAAAIIDQLNKKFPCVENEEALKDLKSAIQWLNLRKQDRTKRGVEGKNEV